MTFPAPLVPVDWLGARVGEPGLVAIDASWYLAAQRRNALGEYLAGHLPGAVFWDLDALSEPASPYPHMLPDPDTLARRIGMLGIGTGDRVVVYDGSGNNLSAARVWWTFRVLGHDAVAVLDGGLGAWRRAGLPLSPGWLPWAPRQFRAQYRSGLVRTRGQVGEAVDRGSAQLLDARSPGRFHGTEPEPRPGLRSGHIPGASNLHWALLTGDDGLLLDPAGLRARFESAGIDLSRPVITTCGSGVTACALALGLELVGHRDWAVYDGSWSEWGQERET